VQQAVLGLLCQALYLAGVFWAAAAGVPAGTSALVTSLQPALVVAVGALTARRRPPGAHVVGLALGTAGVVLTAAADLGNGTPLPALALPLGAMVSLTAGTLLQERWSRPADAVMPALAVQSLVAAGFAVGLALPTGEFLPPAVPGFWLAVGWAVLAGTGGYGLYAVVTARDGAARASTLLYLTPAVTTLWAVPFFGRTLPALTLLGLGAGLVAVLLLRRDRRCSERVPLPSTG
jgi:drug/metabolite transporter (DMT)-like permease